jgi:hypothetical protein
VATRDESIATTLAELRNFLLADLRLILASAYPKLRISVEQWLPSADRVTKTQSSSSGKQSKMQCSRNRKAALDLSGS